MENQGALTEAPAELTPEQKAIENTKGVIKVIEGLFLAVEKGSFPLSVHVQVSHGMSFLAQFHQQLTSQLPPAVVAEMRAKVEAENGPKA